MRTRFLLALMCVVLLCRSHDVAASPESDPPAQLDPFSEAVGFWGIDSPDPGLQFMADFEFDGKTVRSRLAFHGWCGVGDLRWRVEAQWFGNRLHMRIRDSWEYLATFREGRFVIESATGIFTFSRTDAASRTRWEH